jgi:hypothetical protein
MEDLSYIGYLYGAIIGGSSIGGALWFQYILWKHTTEHNRSIVIKLLSIPYGIIVGGWIGAIIGTYSPILLLIYILQQVK